jgi:ABC-type polysaccharide/polyol phosphate export permease
LRFWFYLSPALYSVKDRIPPRFQNPYMLNPFAALFESYKNIMVRGQPPTVFILVAALTGLVILVLGLVMFDKKDDRFAKDV